MAEFKHIFKNSGIEINNDVVYDQLFQIENFSYTFLIKPKVIFWRLGIRLSKNEDVQFHHPEKRYTGNEFDLHLGIGDWNNTSWSSSNKIELVRYYLTTSPEIIGRCESYIEESEVQWDLTYNANTKALYISYRSGECYSETEVDVYDYKYFKVFAWADKTEFEIDCTIEISPLIKSDASSSDEVPKNSFVESNINTADVPYNNSLIETSNISDVPSKKDSLSRKALSSYVAKRLRYIFNRDIDKEKFGSFFMHIDGAWGSGKSTLLRFLQEELENKAPEDPKIDSTQLSQQKWIIVNFNAWQNQRLDPPWLFLMKSVYNEGMKHLRKFNKEKWRNLFVSEYWWRFTTGTNYLIAVIVTLILFITALSLKITSQENFDNLPFVQLVTFIGFLWSLTKFLRSSLVPGSGKAARSFIEENGNDPAQIIASHFSKQIEKIGYPVSVFIDDLDRCNKEYGIKLLDVLQTLFRNAPVIYVIAADRKWLAKMYEDQYSNFSNVISKPAKPLGWIFLDKIFQLILELPAISIEQKAIYWNNLLNIDDPLRTKISKEEDSKIKEQVQSARNNSEKLNIINQPGETLEKQQLVREHIVSSLSIGEEEKFIEHRLQKFVALVEPNPRAMKRLINDISTAKAIAFLYNQDIEEDELILWTILKLQYPLLAEFFWDNPEKTDQVMLANSTTNKITMIDEYDLLLEKFEVKQLFQYNIEGKQINLNSSFLAKMKFQ